MERHHTDCCRLELTLRTEVKQATGYEKIKPGQIVTGKVARVEAFGVFVRLDDQPVTGLLHKSQVSDKYLRDVSMLFKQDQGNLLSPLLCVPTRPRTLLQGRADRDAP